MKSTLIDNEYPKHPLPMYLCTFEGPFEVAGKILDPGTYWFDAVTMSMASRFTPPVHVASEREFVKGHHEVTLFMPGAHGDLLFLTPLVKELERRGYLVSVACLPGYAQMLEGFCHTVDIPLLEKEPERPREWFINLSHLTERPEVLGRNVVDALFDMVLGCTPTDGKLEYKAYPSEIELALQMFPRKHKYRLGVQAHPSCKTRMYPSDLQGQVLAGLHAKLGRDLEVIMLDPPDAAPVPKSLQSVCRSTAEFKCTMRQSAAVALTCDSLLTPDSVFAHIAGANDLPCVVPMATFDRDERFKYAPSVRVLKGSADCAPCRHHRGAHFGPYPEGCGITSPTERQCRALANISPERVIGEVVKQLRK